MADALTDDVWWIDLGSVNAYLVHDDVPTLVDAGLPWDADDLAAGVREAGVEPSAVERVLVTHYDPDHVGGIPRLAATDAAVFVGERDADVVAGRRPPAVDSLKGLTQRVGTVLHDTVDRPVTALADGDEVGSFTTVHTPGHTKGHVAYVSESSDVAFVGDLVTSDGDAFSPSPWYLNWDTDEVERSIDRLLERLPPVDVVAPGHGPPITEEGAAVLARLG